MQMLAVVAQVTTFFINSGSTASSTSLSGREWHGDHICTNSSFISIKGSSSASSVSHELWSYIDPVPYRTARISTSKFSYTFQLNAGQKFIRLHFNPASYYGDERFHDLFTVKAGPLVLLTNFSASTTACALGYTTFTKEFCVTVQENQPLDIIFSPAPSTTSSQDKYYAFINGIEIITLLPGLSYCHAGDIGVQGTSSSLSGSRNSFTSLVIAALCVVNIVAYKLRQNWEVNNICEEENRLLKKAKHLWRRFSLSDIKSATDNFHDERIIGKGGFGDVYKGFIDNKEQIVAIKRLKSNSSQGKYEFWTEIETLSELRHVNLVSLIGYCYEQGEMILVYEHVPSGSLADHLYKLSRKNKPFSLLSWKQRLKICIGAGRGLDYLHTGRGIIHRDVKTSNILLDENFVPKVSDFGLAKMTGAGQLQRQANPSVKGTFGYLDPNYFRTCRLTTKSDTYSFGVVLLEVLCGRPAVEQLADDDKCSLAKWARENISRGEVYQIVAPSIREEISPGSLTTFIRIAERCIDDVPEKRPAIAHVVVNLEFALEQQENRNPLSVNGMTSVSDFFPRTDNKTQKENLRPLLHNMVTTVTNLLTCYDTTYLSESTVQFPSPQKERVNTKMVSARKKDGRKTTMHNMLRNWPWDASRITAKQSKKGEMVSTSVSASSSQGTRMHRTNEEFWNTTGTRNSELLAFNFLEVKTITRDFSIILGEGGFGKVYKGWLDKGGRSTVAVKRLNTESHQGFTEWRNEVHLLAEFSHPNVVTLLGYCCEDNELLLLYEYMSKGALDTRLFNQGFVAVEPLGWNSRVNILTGVARGLAFLHESDRSIVFRDVKTSNILLDEWYNAKLADFGLAKWCPTIGSDASTRVMGTYGYAAPDYVATGHINMKSDSYSFGVVMVETLTGLRVIDLSRPSEQRNLVDWIKPLLPKKKRMAKFMDPRLEGRYPVTPAFQMARLAQNCLESDPKKRPSMQEIVEKLEKLDTYSPVSTTGR